MKKFTLFLVQLLLISFVASSQESNGPVRKHAIGITPQTAIINGFRPEFDFALGKHPGQWLIFSPMVFLSPDQPSLYNYKSMWGFGMEFQHRYYLRQQAVKPEGFYMGYGPTFHYFSISDERLHAEQVTLNGIEYTEVRYGEVTTGIYKFGLTATGGYQFLLNEAIYMDIYAGAGIRLSFDDSGMGGFHKYYNDWYGDYGYSGTLITLGLRFGLLY